MWHAAFVDVAGPLTGDLLLGRSRAPLGCGASDAPFDAPACATLVTEGKIAVVGEDKYDLLFVVDDSPSMADGEGFLRSEPRDGLSLVGIVIVTDQDDGSPSPVFWDLPPADSAPSDTPTRCDEVPALLTLDARQPVGERGGQRCVVRQLAVTGLPAEPAVEPGFGWYFDDFSDDVQRQCTTTPKQKIQLSPGAEPPLGVQPSYECVETQPLAPATGDIEEDEAFPELFDACDPRIPDACARLLRDRNGLEPSALFDRSLVCHPERAMCVVPCADGACPDGWTCNDGSPAWCEPGECRVPG